MVMLSWNGFSQTDTTRITLSVDVARKVAADLVEGDFAKKQVDILKEVVTLQQEVIGGQTTQISVLEEQVEAQKLLLTYSEAESLDRLQAIEDLNKRLRKQQSLSTGLRIGGVTLVVGLGILLVLK